LRILIVYTSQSGNTKKVVDLVKEQLLSKGHNVTVKNALTVTPEKADEAELLVIDAIKSRNGKLLDLITNKRSNKSILVSDILECISSL